MNLRHHALPTGVNPDAQLLGPLHGSDTWSNDGSENVRLRREPLVHTRLPESRRPVIHLGLDRDQALDPKCLFETNRDPGRTQAPREPRSIELLKYTDEAVLLNAK